MSADGDKLAATPSLPSGLQPDRSPHAGTAAAPIALNRTDSWLKRIARNVARAFRGGRPTRFQSRSASPVKDFKERAWRSSEAAQRYLAATRNSTLGMETEHEVVRAFAHGHVLDIGSGPGRIAGALALEGHPTVAVDISQEMLALARSVHQDAFHSVMASAFQLPFPDECFDTVTAFWLLLHFPDWPGVLREALRVAKPQAAVIFEIQNAHNLEAARRLSPSAPFLEWLATPEGFHAFTTQAEMEALAVSCGASLIASRRYDLLNDNFVAQATLGARYPAWLEEMNRLLDEPSCRRFWEAFERDVLPRLPVYLARKQVLVLRKGLVGSSHRPLSDGRQPDSGGWEPTPAVERSYELFREAFGPACPELPEAPARSCAPTW